jgi:hypothetical protein
MTHMDSINVPDIEAFINHQKDSAVFALKLKGKKDIIIETRYRSEIMFNLISIVETLQITPFKVYSA